MSAFEWNSAAHDLWVLLQENSLKFEEFELYYVKPIVNYTKPLEEWKNKYALFFPNSPEKLVFEVEHEYEREFPVDPTRIVYFGRSGQSVDVSKDEDAISVWEYIVQNRL